MFHAENYIDQTRTPHWRCSIFGCELESFYPVCHHCGSDAYGDIDFVEVGILDRVRMWLEWNVLQWIRARRCEVCRKKTGRGPDAAFCCAKCFPGWVPF